MEPTGREELYQAWLEADQGCDMSWEEWQTYHCLVCDRLREEIKRHQLGGHPHESSR